MGGKMIAFAILPILLLQAGEYCPYFNTLTDSGTIYCVDGCCGSAFSDSSDVCCEVVNVGVIAGSVVGGLVGLGIFIAIIVCCCCACGRSGRSPGAVVIHPTNTSSPTIVMNNSTSVAQGMSMNPGPAYGQTAYPYGPAPPGYVPYENLPQERAYPPAYAAKY
ncbi:hypothetical protein ACJMK2_000413 [Sinanodonta woodiana]|uniref:Cysteine and tyrosine-rich protein 1 n=1 Tax=Sinanodonta woodiana TaxID=1069815 RepID=A0ABD3XQX5_SINWO